MTKRLTVGGSRLAFCLLSAMTAGCLLVSMAFAAEIASPVSPATNPVTTSLVYQETDYSIMNYGVPVTEQAGPFKQEPAGVSGKTVRGVLNFDGEAGNSIPFIWQRTAGKLYLDLNRDGTFTNPAGVFSVRGARLGNYQTFTNVRLPLTTSQGRSRMLADLDFYDYGARLNCYLSVRCFWQGRVTLHGQDWQVGTIPSEWVEKNGGRNLSFQNRLLLRPWESRNQPFNNGNGSLETFPFSQKLFFDGQAYQLAWLAGATNGEVKPALQFTEQSAALGDLKITGQNIQRLILLGGTYQVVLDHPGATVKIPVGSYDQPEVLLKQGNVEAYLNFNQRPAGQRVSVDGKTSAVLNVGGPLTNSVLASRHGQDLSMNYRLVGAGGGTYQLLNQDRTRPPTFAVFKGDRKIAAGKFEFG
jgi:hypothetical protein